MRRIFQLAKAYKLEAYSGSVQHLTKREVSFSNQVNQANKVTGGQRRDNDQASKKGSEAGKGGSRSPSSSSKSLPSKKSSSASPSRPKSTRRGSLQAESMESSRVRQDKAANRFIIDLGNNQVARIDYKCIGKNKLELYHSEVPSELRGRGIGKALAMGAFEIAANSNTKLRLTCSYLDDCMNKLSDPRFKKLVEK